MASRGKRKRAKQSNPNPLFCQWLQEWKDEAESKGWKSACTYHKALSSLKKYPLRLERGKDCKILMNVGDKICAMLDKKLSEHVPNGSVTLSDEESRETSLSRRRKTPELESSAGTNMKPVSADLNSAMPPVERNIPKVGSGKRPYVPAHRSGAYAILMALYQHTQLENHGEYLIKADLIRLAESFSDKSFTVTDGGSHYTAFSSMKTLTSKYLVEKYSCPAKYRLTGEGVTLAKQLHDQSDSTIPSSDQPAASSHQSKTQTEVPKSSESIRIQPAVVGRSKETKTSQAFTVVRSAGIGIPSSLDNLQINTSTERKGPQPIRTSDAAKALLETTPLFTLHPSQYEILLLVDNREHFGFGRAKQLMLPCLNKNAVKFDVRPLNVGDFVWIAQEKYGDKREVVLDFIIERKRMDDLSGSIVDGRYKEQKLRMKQSGLRKPIYLIEYYATQDNARIKEDALLQATMNTQIIDEFYVKRCDSVKDSIAYISLLHRQIVKIYQDKIVHGYSKHSLPQLPFNMTDHEQCHMTYADFNSAGSKTKPPTVTDSFKRMLMCVPGVSLDKANAIVESYSSIRSLTESYQKCASEKDRINLLSSFKIGDTKRRLGDACSKNIHTMFYSPIPLL
ncbi:crossover junction endonuclease MUS81-like [Watersipora subatra]|uniref:crossover junction endonuclease MUS81-like n=1 Tax=Watersipora subatra TaxID=2589382 RepID=UPI00355AE639